MKNYIRTLLGVVLLGAMATSAIEAVNMNSTTYFTFRGAVQLAGVALPAGTYIFEVANPNGGANVVRVLSRDRSRVYVLQNTIPTYRPSTGHLASSLKLGESPAGTPPAIQAWFPENKTRGHQFSQ